MKKKLWPVLVVGLLIGVLLIASSFMQDSKEVGSEEYDTAYYVEDNGNLFIKTAKMLDKCCYYVVDIVISGIGSVFSSILGG